MLFRLEDIYRLKENKQVGNEYSLICDVARYGKDTCRISVRR